MDAATCSRGMLLSVLTQISRRDCITSKLPPLGLMKVVVKEARGMLEKDESLIKLYGDFVIVGDIHGNVDDLLRVFAKKGYPPETRYLFLGDYVDRGAQSIEVMMILYSLKVLFPDKIYLIRGNHECENITTAYGFKQECCRRVSVELYKAFIKSFEYLPFAAVVNDKYFCVHGGISPQLKSLSDIGDLVRPMIYTESCVVKDIVWSDPRGDVQGFKASDRGIGWIYGEGVLRSFLARNGLKMLIRSHEVADYGFDEPLDKCLTVFSNTDYCGMGNSASVAVISVEFDEPEIVTLMPLTEHGRAKRRVIMPEWLISDIDSLESSPVNEARAERGDLLAKVPLDISIY